MAGTFFTKTQQMDGFGNSFVHKVTCLEADLLCSVTLQKWKSKRNMVCDVKSKKTLAIFISLFVCMAHTTGLCFASYSPPILETKNYKLETDSYDITAGAIPSPTLQRTAQNTFDAADKLISSSVRYGQGADSTPHITETFQYDGNGALTNWQGSPLWKGGGGNAAGGLSLSYDALGRLLTDGEALACTYDALGNRLQTVGCCSITPEIWVPNHADPLKRPLMMYDAEEDEVYYYYIWGGNRLLGVIENGEFWNEDDALFVAHSDEIGSVIAFTDLSGNVLYSANYGPHGEDWGSTGFNPTPFAWLGGYGVQTLETDTPLRLYLTRHRVYSATLNRFLSSDPIGLAGGANLYAYGEGKPFEDLEGNLINSFRKEQSEGLSDEN